MHDFVLSCLESRMEKDRTLYARFLIAPFLKGDALTVGTALRRSLLSSVESIGITAIYIQGITHEFSTIVGVRESVLELSLNFQKIVLCQQKTHSQANSQDGVKFSRELFSGCARTHQDAHTHSERLRDQNPVLTRKTFQGGIQVGYLHVKGPKVVYANDLTLPSGISLVDPTQHIATLSSEGLLVVKFVISDTPFTESQQLNWSTKKNTHIESLSLRAPKKAEPSYFLKPLDVLKKKALSNVKVSHRKYQSRQFLQSAKRTLKTKLFSQSFVRDSSALKMTSMVNTLDSQSISQAKKKARYNFSGSRSEIGFRNVIPLDFVSTPVTKVNFTIETDDLSQFVERRKVSNTNTPFLFHTSCKPKTSLSFQRKQKRVSRTRRTCGQSFLQPPLREKQYSLHTFVPKSFSKSSTCTVRIPKKDLCISAQSFSDLLSWRGLKGFPPQITLSSSFQKKEKLHRKGSFQMSGSEACMMILPRSFKKRNAENTQLSSAPLLVKPFLSLRSKLAHRMAFGQGQSYTRPTKTQPFCKRKNKMPEIAQEGSFSEQNQVRERLILEVWTNGSIHPHQAVHEASLSLIDMFSPFRYLFQLHSYSQLKKVS